MEDHKVKTSNSCSSCSVDYDYALFYLSASDDAGVNETCETDNSSTVLIVMKDGNVHDLFEFSLYIEAIWSSYIF